MNKHLFAYILQRISFYKRYTIYIIEFIVVTYCLLYCSAHMIDIAYVYIYMTRIHIHILYYKVLGAPHISTLLVKMRKFPLRNLIHDKFMMNFSKNFGTFFAK